MLRRSTLWLSALFLALPAMGQPPVFSPKPKPKPAEARPGPVDPGKKVDAGKGEPKKEEPGSQDPIETLVERMRRWPARSSRQAALVLAGLGTPAKERLIQGLAENDWRIQAGCAFALAEMGDTSCLDALRRAIRNEANRASLPELLRAIVRIDPVTGPGAVIPHLAHSSAKVRVAARAALPEVIGDRYLPDVLALLRNQRAAVRVTALDLLGRIPGQAERREFFDSLGDPESSVAFAAARHLASTDTPLVRARLLELGRTAPVRQGAYSMLALVMLEDSQQDVVIPGKGRIQKRAQQFLTSDDPFYAGTAAVVLSNVSYRSNDPTIRELANKYLPPILLGTVAGGIFFSDYASLEDLCWQKLHLLTGADLGQSAVRWRKWWAANEKGFVARRELRGISAAELRHARIRMIRTGPDGSITDVSLSGDEEDLLDERPGAPLVLGKAELPILEELLASCDLFATRGDRVDRQRLDASIEFDLRLPRSAMGFRRLHYGPTPESLRPLAAWMENTRRSLAWQRLMPATAASRASFVNEQRAFFDTETDAERRKERLLTLALSSWPTLTPTNRSLALSVLASASPDWIIRHRPRLVGLLRGENRLTEQAAGLVQLLASHADQDVRAAVIDVVTAAPSLDGDDVLRRFLARQPLPGVVPLMRDDRARVRAIAAETLARFDGEGEVVGILIQGLKDYEPRVQDACLKSLATMKDERILGMLNAVIDSDEHSQVRMRAIEALGTVGRSQVVPRLMELFRGGDRHVKWAVIRALSQAGGRRAINGLSSIVRNPGDVELKKEALDALAGLGGKDVGDELRKLLARSKELDIKVMAIGSLAKVMGVQAVPTLSPYIESQEPAVKRMALLTLARLGSPAAAPGLLEMMSKPEGDMAAENAFQNLTFQVSHNPSPPRRYQTYKSWFETYGTRDRSEWFVLEARASLDEIDDQVDWMTATELADPHVRVLITLLEKGNRPIRVVADATLRRVSKLMIDPVGGTELEATERAEIYKRWLSKRE